MISDYNIESIIHDYQVNNFSLRKLSQQLKTSDSKIKEILTNNNIKIKPRGSKRTLVNDDYFSEINSEEKAYFLGLLFSDGCVFHRPNCESIITISLQKRDSYILHEMKKHFDYQGNIRFKKRQQPTHKDQETLTICSNKISNDLIKLGCVTNKSLILQFPVNKIPDHLMRHFIRGLFDGDGSIASQKKELKNGQISHIFRFDISGTYSICEGVKNVFINQIGLQDRKIIQRKDHRVCVCALNGNKNVKQIYHYLYDDATIFLTRKKEKMFQVFS